MGRPRVLTDEQRKQNRENLDSVAIPFNVQNHFKEKLDKFAKRYPSRNSAILYLIKTHPDFKNFTNKENSHLK